MPRLTWSQVAAWRLRRQHLDRRRPRHSMLEVTARLCGLHAQVLSSAELTLWARIEGLRPDDVKNALWHHRTLVKTWAMRGTLHLLPSKEYPLWQAALSTFGHFLKPAWLRYLGLTLEELHQLTSAISRALDGQTLTRQELARRVAAITGSARLGNHLRQGWGLTSKPAAFGGLLCFGPVAGQNVRFTRPDQWLGPLPAVDSDAAFVEIARRFLAAHGPATHQDFGRWWGLPLAKALARIQALGAEAAQVDVEGTRAWMLRKHVQEAARADSTRSVRLLPAFDQFVITASPRAAAFLPGPFKTRVYRPQGWISPVLLVNGRMDGVWRHQRKAGKLEILLEPFVKLPSWALAAAEEEAGRLAAFLGGAPELR